MIPGKRYRATFDGVADDDGNLVIQGYFQSPQQFVGEPELLPDPLPTRVGSVVLAEDGMAWQLRASSADPSWHSVRGSVVTPGRLVRQAGRYIVLHSPEVDW